MPKLVKQTFHQRKYALGEFIFHIFANTVKLYNALPMSWRYVVNCSWADMSFLLKVIIKHPDIIAVKWQRMHSNVTYEWILIPA